MDDYSSLLFFTVLCQSAAGLMIFESFRKDVKNGHLWLALGLTALGALASVGHLGQPFRAIFALGNPGSSWLSREIAMCVIFAASIIACIVCKKRWVTWLSAALGVLFIYTMARVYILPTQPVWDTCATFGYFLMSAILLGGATLLLLDAFDQSRYNPLLGYEPFAMMGAMCLCVYYSLLLMPDAASPARSSAIVHIVLLVAAAGLYLPYLIRLAAFAPQDTNSKQNALIPTGCCCALVWIAALIGRVSFYKSYFLFGM